MRMLSCRRVTRPRFLLDSDLTDPEIRMHCKWP